METSSLLISRNRLRYGNQVAKEPVFRQNIDIFPIYPAITVQVAFQTLEPHSIGVGTAVADVPLSQDGKVKVERSCHKSGSDCIGISIERCAVRIDICPAWGAGVNVESPQIRIIYWKLETPKKVIVTSIAIPCQSECIVVIRRQRYGAGQNERYPVTHISSSIEIEITVQVFLQRDSGITRLRPTVISQRY